MMSTKEAKNEFAPTNVQLDWHKQYLSAVAFGVGRGIWMIGGHSGLPSDSFVPVHVYEVDHRKKTVTLKNSEVRNGDYHRFTTKCINLLGYSMAD